MFSVSETAMGAPTHDDVNSLAAKYFKPLHTLASTMLYRVTRVWLYWDAIFQFSPVAKIQNDALKTLRKFTTQIIQDRREYRKNHYINTEEIDDDECDVYGKKPKLAMLDLLLDEEKKGTIDEKGITEEVDTFMFEVSTSLLNMYVDGCIKNFVSLFEEYYIYLAHLKFKWRRRAEG